MRIRLDPDLEAEDLLVFHAGSELVDGTLLTSGGRVLAVTALADTFAHATERSRAAAALVEFEGAFFRRDIGWREENRLEDT
jgi:phosphoribosylamine--glycine ligase